MFGVVDETTTTKFARRACAVHCISLPVVVDEVVVVVLKFPIADDLVVFNPPKLPTTQMILFAEFLYATLFLKLSLQTTNNSKKELIIVKGFFPSLLHGSVFFFFYRVSI